MTAKTKNQLRYDRAKRAERAALIASDEKILRGDTVISDSTPFTTDLTIGEFCSKLEECKLVIARVEKMVGACNGSIRHRMNREPWATFFASKYPHKYGKKGIKAQGRSDWLTTSVIPCMVEGCLNTVTVTHEVETGLPRGIRKRCQRCRGVDEY